MTDTLRDQMAKICATAKWAQNPKRAYEKADAILALMRDSSRRDEVLEALGGREEMRRRDQRYGDEPIWVFGDGEPERGSMVARHMRALDKKFGRGVDG